MNEHPEQGLIAVSGATGYVGTATAASLRALGTYRIRALARASDAVLDADEVVIGSVVDPDACERLVAGADIVIHAAGLVRSRDAAALRDVNVEGTARLLAAARQTRVRRFIHVSSTGVYGHPGTAVDEDSPRRPRGPYEQSKAEAERLVLETAADAVVVQPSNVIGPGHPERPLRRFLATIRSGRPVVHSGAWTNYVGVADVARVIVSAATATHAPRVVIVNSPLPLEQLVVLARGAVGGSTRTIELPATVGGLLRRPLGALTMRMARLGRLEALVDATRFRTLHESWLQEHDAIPDLGATLRALAIEHGSR